MNLSASTADAIKDRYSSDEFGSAFHTLLRRRGMAIFTDDARRELILALGDERRSRNAWNLWRRNGGDTSRPWSKAYREFLNAAFRRSTLIAARASVRDEDADRGLYIGLTRDEPEAVAQPIAAE